MTSPVNTSVKFFSSLMPNAPVLSGAAGAGIAVLDACLKDGFDTKGATIAVAGGVATVTWSGVHSAVPESVIQVTGATGAWTALNGEQKVVTKPNATSCTFATAAPDGAVTGTITIKMAPLGWAKPFSGTNLAAYQSQSVLSPKHLLRVDDSSATLMRVVGYESMTDINTGVGAFPSNAQISGGGMWPKRQAASATGVVWFVIGDERMFYFVVVPYASGPTAYAAGSTIRGFGDPIPYKPSGDAYATVLNMYHGTTVSAAGEGDFANPNVSNMYSPRSFTALGAPVAQYANTFTGGSVSGIQASLGAFPNAIDGALYMAKKFVALSGGDGSPRAEIPGIRHVPQSVSVNQFVPGEVWPGAGSDAGKSMLVVRCTNAALSTAPTDANTGVLFFDVTGPWR
jgi:hypothetical protein